MSLESKIYDREFKQSFTKADVDEFTATAQHFTEYKVYTREPFKSKRWYDFWKEERRRCLEGYNISRDYITGYHYFYLNYAPMLKTKVIKENLDGQNQADRIEGFPNFWDGDYDWFHYIEEAEQSGQHAMLLGSRGRGKSLKTGSMLVRNYEHIPNSKNYAFAYSEEYLTNDGLLTKAWSVMDHISIYTPWAKSRDYEDSGLHREAAKKIRHQGVWTRHPRSYKSEIMGVVVGDRINKTRGKRGKLVIYEEVGMFKKSEQGWQMNRPAMEDGKNTFGLQLAIGTGGSEKNDFSGAALMWKQPKAYRIYPVTNRWDLNKENTQIGYFWPGYINCEGCYNVETGVSDKAAGLRFIEEDRAIVALSNDPDTLTRRKAEIPIYPDEVLMRISHSIFPKEELTAQETDIENNPHRYKDADFVGRLTLDKSSQKYKWINDSSKTPIYKFPHVNNKNMEGAIVIYEHPKEDNDGEVYQNRYFGGCDSYDHDESSTKSLGSIKIGDLYTKRVVAEYTGRPKTADEFYEITRRLLLYYNARVNIESHNKGIFTYFKNKNCEYLILSEPKIVRELVSDTSMKREGRRKLGTPPIPALQQYGRGAIVKWLLGTTHNPDKEEEMNVHKHRNITDIKEMLLWNEEGNYDRVDALSMLMFAWEDAEVYKQESELKVKDLAKDDYFVRNYKGAQYRWKTKIPN